MGSGDWGTAGADFKLYAVVGVQLESGIVLHSVRSRAVWLTGKCLLFRGPCLWAMSAGIERGLPLRA